MVPPNQSFDRNLPEEGTYKARCIQIIHEGTIMEDFMGKPKSVNAIRFIWELLDCYDPETGDYPIFNEEKGPQPYTVNKKYSYILSEKSNLFGLISRWTKNSKLSTEQLLAYDVSQLLGKPCNITIEIKTSKQGKDYVDIVLISPPVKPKPGQPGYDAPQNELVLFDVDDFDEEDFKKLWPWIQKEIAETDEFKEQFPGRKVGDNKAASTGKKKPLPPTDFDDEEDEEEEEEFEEAEEIPAPKKRKATPPAPPAKTPAKAGKQKPKAAEPEEEDPDDWAF